jgi:predicted nucleic acid-binding protein
VTVYLADKSALARAHHPAVASRLGPLFIGGDVATCGIADLARKGQHRGVTIPDLLIAAAAEAAGLTVLHYDSDFDRIAEITGQPVEWIVPPGSVP